MNAEAIAETDLVELHSAVEKLKARDTALQPAERHLLTAVGIINKLVHQNRGAERQHGRELARRQRQMQALLELVRMTEQQRIEPMLEACEQAARRKERERLRLAYNLPAEVDSCTDEDESFEDRPSPVLEDVAERAGTATVGMGAGNGTVALTLAASGSDAASDRQRARRPQSALVNPSSQQLSSAETMLAGVTLDDDDDDDGAGVAGGVANVHEPAVVRRTPGPNRRRRRRNSRIVLERRNSAPMLSPTRSNATSGTHSGVGWLRPPAVSSRQRFSADMDRGRDAKDKSGTAMGAPPVPVSNEGERASPSTPQTGPARHSGSTRRMSPTMAALTARAHAEHVRSGATTVGRSASSPVAVHGSRASGGAVVHPRPRVGTGSGSGSVAGGGVVGAGGSAPDLATGAPLSPAALRRRSLLLQHVASGGGTTLDGLDSGASSRLGSTEGGSQLESRRSSLGASSNTNSNGNSISDTNGHSNRTRPLSIASAAQTLALAQAAAEGRSPQNGGGGARTLNLDVMRRVRQGDTTPPRTTSASELPPPATPPSPMSLLLMQHRPAPAPARAPPAPQRALSDAVGLMFAGSTLEAGALPSSGEPDVFGLSTYV